MQRRSAGIENSARLHDTESTESKEFPNRSPEIPFLIDRYGLQPLFQKIKNVLCTDVRFFEF